MATRRIAWLHRKRPNRIARAAGAGALLLSLGAGSDSIRSFAGLGTGEPEKIPTNIEAATPSKIDRLWAAPYGLTGGGVVIGAWDEGIVQASHPDLAGRVTAAETGTVSGHSTHVAGTLVGSGFAMPTAKGMAPGSTLLSYGYFGDVLGQQAAAQSSHGMAVSNHSWNYAAGWVYNRYGGGKWVWYGGAGNTKDPDFGAYDYVAQGWDKLVAERGLIIVKSSGNDRSDTGAGSAPHYHIGDSSTLHTDWHGPDGDYDSIGQIGAAKNLITVGAVDAAGGMTAFSAWGPTDDGRIKPDIVATGVSLYSTWLNNGYTWLSGTSMSTPVVSGAVALIVERYRAIAKGQTPAPHLVKALLAHSARDLGNKGPDYVYGWGLLDAQAAVSLVNDGVGPERRIEAASVTNGAEQSLALVVPASTPRLKVTIAWTDPPAVPGAAKALVNDLDLELIAPDGTVHYPYSLAGLTNPSAPATAVAPNRVDNIEQVVVESPAAGAWQARVKGKTVLGMQEYALVNGAVPAAGTALLSISINQGAVEVPSRDVTVSLRGSSEAGVSGYYLSESPASPSAADFTPVPTATTYQTDLSYTLSAGGGNKTVYAWLRDPTGNISAQASETVTLAAGQSVGGGGAVDAGVLILMCMALLLRAPACRAGTARL
ncbi:MAG: S8 family serine peptidase [Gammaproteobacteria bacterium]|nr:S8 family serine peptidase [Gammaproteobacteria bacterium]